MHWWDNRMTWADGVRLLLVFALTDYIASSKILTAYLTGLMGG